MLGLAGAYAGFFCVVSGAPSLCALALSVTSQSGVVGVVDLFREQNIWCADSLFGVGFVLL